MIEKETNSPKNERRVLITKMVQNPVEYLIQNNSKGVVEAIYFLIELRTEIKNDSMYSIENPNPHFAQFYRTGNGQSGYYEGIVRLLKEAGHTKEEVELGFFDFLSAQVSDSADNRSGVDVISKLYNTAIKAVFDR